MLYFDRGAPLDGQVLLLTEVLHTNGVPLTCQCLRSIDLNKSIGLRVIPPTPQKHPIDFSAPVKRRTPCKSST
jgi:hypothetical protein